jgi:excisionase family DNA binding protein
MPTDIMTVEELADYLKLDPQTIYRRFRRGELPGVRIGRAIRFRRDVIEGWLRAASYGWDSQQRAELRKWAGEFAERKRITDRAVVKAVRARRKTHI